MEHWTCDQHVVARGVFKSYPRILFHDMTGAGLLSVPKARTTLGMRSFAVTGPVIWNSLPAALRSATRPLDICSTSEPPGPPVRLIDSSSEDHLCRALKIYSSLSLI